MWLKGCPKCRGDLFEEPAVGAQSVAVRFITCLQCGHTLSEDEEQDLQRPTAVAARTDRSRVA
jgi:predicted nucleic-acid-binding Zn-ribbon protein